MVYYQPDLRGKVRNASSQLDDHPPVPDPRDYKTTGEQYRAYCEWASEVALRNGVEPQFVEYIMFLCNGKIAAWGAEDET